jgi:hypothetical protein
MPIDTGIHDSRITQQRIADHQRELDELRAAMRARAELQPDTPEYQAALAHEEALLERIHRWSLGQEAAGRGSTPG